MTELWFFLILKNQAVNIWNEIGYFVCGFKFLNGLILHVAFRQVKIKIMQNLMLAVAFTNFRHFNNCRNHFG